LKQELIAAMDVFMSPEKSIAYILVMQFAHPIRTKVLYEQRFYKELKSVPKILDIFLYDCIHYDSKSLDELIA